VIVDSGKDTLSFENNCKKAQDHLEKLKCKIFDPLFHARKKLVDEARAEGLMLNNAGGSCGLINSSTINLMPQVMDGNQKIFEGWSSHFP